MKLVELRILVLGAALGAGVLALRTSQADPIPPGWQAHDMRPVGYSDLGGRRGAGKLAIKQHKGRWYLYRGGNGFSIVDVTDPADPKFIKAISAPPNTSMGQISLHGDLLVAGLARPITEEESSGRADGWGIVQPRSPDDKPFKESVLLYDIGDPTNPKQLSQWEGHAAGTHRNVYPGGKYAFLSSTMPGYRGFILVILDVSDPRNPREAGRWWYPGAKADEKPGEVVPSYHGPAFVSPDGKMLTLGYTPSVVNLDITDIRQPKVIGELRLIPPFANTITQSIHTVVPLWDRKLIYFNGEPMKRNCKEPLSAAGLIDNSDPANPYLVSIFPLPRPPAGAPYQSFCDKPGRFGPHNVNTEIHSPDVQQPGKFIYLTYFTAGLRVFDISDPRQPTETAWFLPPDPPVAVKTQGGELKANATQDVLVDTRGNIYIVDSAWGIWIVRHEPNGTMSSSASRVMSAARLAQ